ncbi:MAG: hypothetical protein H7A10_07565 [Oceanospirillaceae bacterium]|nr:hypothetical protein [Oceanospirillaceae bacterium]
MKYMCAACSAVFPVAEAIDGYAQGYRQGFVCPNCGCNIDEDRESLKGDLTLVLMPLAVILIPVAAYNRSNHRIYWPLLVVGLMVTIALAVVAVLRAIARNRKPIKTLLLQRT